MDLERCRPYVSSLMPPGPMPRSFLLVALVAVAACSDAPSPSPPAGDTLEVIDGRRLGEPASVSLLDLASWEAHPAITDATGAARAYWLAGDGLEEEEVRVMDVAEGAFTEVGSTQTGVLYVLSTVPRCCPRMGLAVVEDGRLVRNVAFVASAHSLVAVPGLADDGRDGLAFGASFGMGGDHQSSVTLASFKGAGLVPLGSTVVAADGCAAMHEGGEASRVTLRADRTLAVERFTRATCAGAWTSAGPEEPLALDPPGVSPYVTLPAG